ncbi:hypothetical protein Peur_073137 [Populus x canadensis]
MGASVPASPEILLTILLFAMSCLWAFPEVAGSKHAGITRHYKFNIKLTNVTRLCHTKSMVTVNGKFPGPRVVAREGDRLVVKVVNHVPNNISIHWYESMEFDNFKVDGQMDQHTSRNALFKQTRLMFTTSLLQDKEELSSGMLTSHGLELLSMDPLSSYLSATFLTHLPNPTRK